MKQAQQNPFLSSNMELTRSTLLENGLPADSSPVPGHFAELRQHLRHPQARLRRQAHELQAWRRLAEGRAPNLSGGIRGSVFRGPAKSQNGRTAFPVFALSPPKQVPDVSTAHLCCNIRASSCAWRSRVRQCHREVALTASRCLYGCPTGRPTLARKTFKKNEVRDLQQ